MNIKKTKCFAALAVGLSILLHACASPSMTTVRAESGALSEDEFLSAPWESSNLDSVATEDTAVLIVEVRGEDGELDPSFSAFLETELNSLQRFPVLAMSAGQGSEEDVAQLIDLGVLNPAGGSAAQKPDVVYRIELQAIPRYMEYSDKNLLPLQQVMVKLHEYWYEGYANLWRLEPNGRWKALWGERNFRSRSQWVTEFVNLKGSHVRGHETGDKNTVDRLYSRCRSSLLFRLSKEVYAKLGLTSPIDGMLQSGDDVLVSIPMGGVFNAQPIFLSYKMGSLQVFLAKAIATQVNSDSATFRVIQWNADDSRAQEMRKNPDQFLSMHSGKVLAKTEGLALPQDWTERAQEIERLMQEVLKDAAWIDTLSGSARKELRAFISSR
jgi:hypothetical protein